MNRNLPRALILVFLLAALGGVAYVVTLMGHNAALAPSESAPRPSTSSIVSPSVPH